MCVGTRCWSLPSSSSSAWVTCYATVQECLTSSTSCPSGNTQQWGYCGENGALLQWGESSRLIKDLILIDQDTTGNHLHVGPISGSSGGSSRFPMESSFLCMTKSESWESGNIQEVSKAHWSISTVYTTCASIFHHMDPLNLRLLDCGFPLSGWWDQELYYWDGSCSTHPSTLFSCKSHPIVFTSYPNPSLMCFL